MIDHEMPEVKKIEVFKYLFELHITQKVLKFYSLQISYQCYIYQITINNQFFFTNYMEF